jgi:hypothetical protein
MAIDWGSLVGTGANALANWYAGKQANQAGQAAQQYADPYGTYRPMAAARLEGLQTNPNLVTQLPGYQFGLDQGQQALTRNMASKGFLGSGNILEALQNQAQGYAGQQFDKERDFQARLAGAYNNPATAAQFGYQGAMSESKGTNQALGSLASGLFGKGGQGSGLMQTGGNYLKDLFAGGSSGASGGIGGMGGSGLSASEMGALNTQAAQGLSGTGELAIAPSGGAGGGGSSLGSTFSSTPPGTSNYLYDLATGGSTGGIGGVGGSGLTASQMGALETQAAQGLAGTGELALTPAAETAGTAAGTGAATGAEAAGAGGFTGGYGALASAAVIPALFAYGISRDNAESAKRLQAHQEHGMTIANELAARGFNPNSIDQSQMFLTPDQFADPSRQAGYERVANAGGLPGGSEIVNYDYLRNLFGGYDNPSIEAYLNYAKPYGGLGGSAYTQSIGAIQNDPRWAQAMAAYQAQNQPQRTEGAGEFINWG